MLSSIKSTSGTSGTESSGGMGGFIKAFQDAMADGNISEAEGKSLMEKMNEVLAEANSSKDAKSEKTNGVEDMKSGADIGLEQDILKMLMGALQDGKVDEQEAQKLNGLLAAGGPKSGSQSKAA